MKNKVLFGAAASIIGAVALAAPASAHVTVNPKEGVPQGSYSKITFRVPTERDNASTTKLEVTFPADKPINSVSVQPQPGWTYVVDRAPATPPVTTEGGVPVQLTSKITWTADANSGIKPHEFGEFNVSVGPLPKDVDTLTFKALQTYSNGEVVRWIEEPLDDDSEPKYPAPVLQLTPANGDAHDLSTEDTDATAAVTDVQEDADTAQTLGIIGVVLGALALLVAVIALATRRRTNS